MTNYVNNLVKFMLPIMSYYFAVVTTGLMVKQIDCEDLKHIR